MRGQAHALLLLFVLEHRKPDHKILFCMFCVRQRGVTPQRTAWWCLKVSGMEELLVGGILAVTFQVYLAKYCENKAQSTRQAKVLDVLSSGCID